MNVPEENKNDQKEVSLDQESPTFTENGLDKSISKPRKFGRKKHKLHRSWWRKGISICYRLIKYSVVSTGAVLGLNIILFQFTFYQTYWIKKALVVVSAKLNFDIELSHVHINLFDSKITLNHVHIRDPKKREMIVAKTLVLDFDYSRLLKDGNIRIDEVILKHAQVNLVVDKDAQILNINQFVDKINDLTRSDKPKDPNKPPSKFMIDDAYLEDSRFSYFDETTPLQTEDGFDPVHFAIDSLTTDVSSLYIVGDTIQAEVSKFEGIEQKAKAKIQNLTTFFNMNSKYMGFENLLLELNRTVIRQHFSMSYDSMKVMKDFVNKVYLQADLKQSVLNTDDLAIFVPVLKKYKDEWHITGNLKGTVSDLILKDLDLRMGKQSHLVGDLSMKGLPNIQKTEMDIVLKQSKIIEDDLNRYLDNPLISGYLKRLALVEFDTDFKGTINEFELKGDFKTGIGQLITDLKLNVTDQTYETNLESKSLDIGQLLERRDIGQVTLIAKLKGKGFNPKQIGAELKIDIEQAGYNQYNYKDLHLEGAIDRLKFEGKILAKDPNLDFDLQGLADFNENMVSEEAVFGRINLINHIQKISLKPLGFSDVDAEIAAKMRLNFTGSDINDFLGEVDIENAHLIYDEKRMDFNLMRLLSLKIGDNKRIDFRSDYLNLNLEGNFLLTQFIKDLQALAQEHILYFKPNNDEIENYYANKSKEVLDYKLKYNINVINVLPITKLFVPEFSISKNIKISGDFTQGDSTFFNLNTGEKGIDSIQFGKNKFKSTDLIISTHKKANEPEIFANIKLSSIKQDFGSLKTEGFLLDLGWKNNVLNFRTFIQQADTTNNFARLQGKLNFNPDDITLNFGKSYFRFLDNVWLITQNNEIKYTEAFIAIKNLVIYNEKLQDASFTIGGKISGNPEDALEVEFDNVNLRSFAGIFQMELEGFVNGKVSLKNLYTRPTFESKLTIDELTIAKKYVIGNIELEASMPDPDQPLKLELNAYLRNDQPFMTLLGTIDLNNKNALSLKLNLRSTELKTAEYFVKDNLSDLSGTATGKLLISGTLNKPIIKGEVSILKGSMKVNYLGTYFTFSDKIYFDPFRIYFKNLIIKDEEGYNAVVNGGVFHEYFKNLKFDIQAKFNNFKILNKPALPNETFYGTAKATGSLKVSGNLKTIILDIDAKNEKGTKVIMPLDGYSEVGEKNYIIFVKPKTDSTQTIEDPVEPSTNIKVNMNLDLNENAEIEMIFDRRSGDIMKAAGNGKIRMEIDTHGDMNMFGNYTITKGKYNFTMLNVVNKGFEIQSGSRINFTGDLFQSQLNITAAYTQRVPLVDLNPDALRNNAFAKTRNPVKVLLGIDGALLAPNIKLDLDLEEIKKITDPATFAEVRLLENKIRTDEGQKNMEVFSLLVLKKLQPVGSYSASGSSATSSLSELLSNQLNNWISQVDENIELSLDVATSQMSLSYKMFDGRLKITRDGAISSQNQSAGTSSNATANAIGDWTVEYMLTNDGRLKAKAYSKNNQNAIGSSSITNANTTVTGFSVLYTRTFDQIKELFQRKNDSKKKKKNNKNNVSESDPKDNS
jgi:TamB, inner membrane protein subunit of TAM complex